MAKARARPGSAVPLREYRAKRNFARTPEPEGGGPRAPAGTLEFVVQKHAASHLHFDLRLQVGGVMKSWAVPKGPSLDPGVKRLAVEVEDHPVEYNDFEGVIPAGEYGGGTVMLWDRGSYVPDDARQGEEAQAAMRRGLRRGRLAFRMSGERLRGSFTLVRTRRGDEGQKPQWLLIKQDDEHAEPGSDAAAEWTVSVATGRGMDEIAAGKNGRRVWRSHRSAKPGLAAAAPERGASAPSLSGLEPMLATSGSAPPGDAGWTFEPKYDGIRVLAFATADSVALVTRNGNDKAPQFPEVAEALRELVREVGKPVVLDGELVGVRDGEIVRFESLQGRMHLSDAGRIRRLADEEPAALVAFDLLLIGDDVALHEPWSGRRRTLEDLLAERASPRLRLGETSPDAGAMQQRARRAGWEGLIAKRTDARYRPGARSRDWLKLKLENQQELVVGGWTEPRGSRPHLGAVLLGYFDAAGEFVYAGHTGTGFSRDSLEEVHRRLRRLERKTSPFREVPRTNQQAHWTTPRLVVQVRFNEWTRDGKLRQPVFVGIREDRDARSVVREPAGPAAAAPAPRERRAGARELGDPAAVARIRALRADDPAGGTLSLGRGASLAVSNLDKPFFPGSGHTKGDLLEFYAAMSRLILPAMRDRPLVLKRYPDGIGGESFYQQSAPQDVPPGVRVETVVPGDEGKEQARLVGGDLATLLYTVQLGAVSYDPWHSRVGALHSADYTILDLDPGEGTGFATVVEVARRVREEMDALGLHGALKTSGSSGLHIYLPLEADTPLEAATLVAQIVATRVAQKHPRIATVERMRKNRRRGTVYVDYLQNILGKTVAGVYAVRAKPGATVSTPLAWDELTDGLDLRAFTVETVPARVAAIGDLWAPAMRVPNDLKSLLTGGNK